MNVQINYKNIKHTKNSTNYVLFTDENYNINGLKKYLLNKEFSTVSDLLKSKDLCKKEQLVGEWTVMFKNYDMAKIYFEMLPEILPNQEHQFQECKIAYVIDPTSENAVVDPSEALP